MTLSESALEYWKCIKNIRNRKVINFYIEAIWKHPQIIVLLRQKKSKNAWFLEYRSATGIKIDMVQVYTYVRPNLTPIWQIPIFCDPSSSVLRAGSTLEPQEFSEIPKSTTVTCSRLIGTLQMSTRLKKRSQTQHFIIGNILNTFSTPCVSFWSKVCTFSQCGKGWGASSENVDPNGEEYLSDCGFINFHRVSVGTLKFLTRRLSTGKPSSTVWLQLTITDSRWRVHDRTLILFRC